MQANVSSESGAWLGKPGGFCVTAGIVCTNPTAVSKIQLDRKHSVGFSLNVGHHGFGFTG